MLARIRARPGEARAQSRELPSESGIEIDPLRALVQSQAAKTAGRLAKQTPRLQASVCAAPKRARHHSQDGGQKSKTYKEVGDRNKDWQQEDCKHEQLC